MRGKSNREQKIVATVACPTCGAPLGQPCRGHETRLPDGRHRLMVCPDRRRAWQMTRDRPPQE